MYLWLTGVRCCWLCPGSFRRSMCTSLHLPCWCCRSTRSRLESLWLWQNTSTHGDELFTARHMNDRGGNITHTVKVTVLDCVVHPDTEKTHKSYYYYYYYYFDVCGIFPAKRELILLIMLLFFMTGQSVTHNHDHPCDWYLNLYNL